MSKGAAVRKITSLEPDADFILCIGDDKTDEDMFAALQHYQYEREKKMFPRDEHAVAEENHDDDDNDGQAANQNLRASIDGDVAMMVPDVYTCVVARQDSQARCFIGNHKHVVNLLAALAKGSDSVVAHCCDDDQMAATQHGHVAAGDDDDDDNDDDDDDDNDDDDGLIKAKLKESLMEKDNKDNNNNNNTNNLDLLSFLLELRKEEGNNK